MQQRPTHCSSRPNWFLKVIGLAIALSLHAGIVAALLLNNETTLVGEPSFEEVVGISLLDMSELDAGEPELAETSTEPSVNEAIALPKPEEPIIESQPEPAPPREAVVEDPVVAEPKPVHKPKLQPQPKPQPKLKPSTSSAHQTPVSLASSSGTQTAAPSEPAGAPKTPKAIDTNKPKIIGQLSYLGRPPQPIYPRASERRKEQGKVVVRVLISIEGKVLETSVQSSSGYERLDNAAIAAVRKAKFKPYTENGIAYRAMADIPFDFVL